VIWVGFRASSGGVSDFRCKRKKKLTQGEKGRKKTPTPQNLSQRAGPRKSQREESKDGEGRCRQPD